MSWLIILLPVSVLLLIAAAAAFLWAVNSGQFDDLDSPAWDVLLDERTKPADHEAAP